MFTKILIANRGEIACRVIRTARRMGIATVAVYSDADANARHVRLADEAVRIGPAEARASYLDGDRIVEAAVQTGAQAVHPGYGFLSENEAFAQACEARGIRFIGPPVEAIRAMGSKSAAKALMEKAGVPLTPGYHGADQDPAMLAREADRIGYPVLIKASAGGGGKGMRRVDAPADFAEALASCQREARNAFGDDHVLVEKYVLRPRHIEIQVFGDTHGNVVHLFERDCSVQRRHQKVLEEAPAPGMTPERRAAMGKAAVDAAKAVGYVGAGTVEFIAQQDGSFWFMEMNTRLQVEHPVTEMITGLDLVEWQLRVASGEPLPMTQDQLRIDGHALEARIYAEDPDRGFLPSTGRLSHLVPPEAGDRVRIDTGVEQGDEITPYYDPMIAKLIVHGDDRAHALALMRRALAQYEIAGVSNNVAFLARLVATPSFANADLDTGLIEREQAALQPDGGGVPAQVWVAAALRDVAGERARQSADSPQPAPGQRVVPGGAVASAAGPWDLCDGWRLNGDAQRTFEYRCGDEACAVRVASVGNAAFRVHLQPRNEGDGAAADARSVGVRAWLGADGATLQMELDDARRLHARVIAGEGRDHVFIDGRSWVVAAVDDRHAGGDADDGKGGLRAPMPGKVIALKAQPGQTVARGDALLVLEAMKMEHTISAPSAGKVVAFRYREGEQVADGAELVEFEAAGA